MGGERRTPRLVFEVANCNLKEAYSQRAKSEGTHFRFALELR